MNDKNENLDELLNDFFDEEKAGAMKDDMQFGDKLFSDNAAPAASDMALEKTAEAMNIALRKTRRQGIHFIRTVAAVLIFAVLVGIVTMNYKPGIDGNNSGGVAVNADSYMWQDDFEVASPELAVLAVDISEIESELMNIRLDEQGNGTGLDTIELEMELYEINNDFWKG